MQGIKERRLASLRGFGGVAARKRVRWRFTGWPRRCAARGACRA